MGAEAWTPGVHLCNNHALLPARKLRLTQGGRVRGGLRAEVSEWAKPRVDKTAFSTAGRGVPCFAPGVQSSPARPRPHPPGMEGPREWEPPARGQGLHLCCAKKVSHRTVWAFHVSRLRTCGYGARSPRLSRAAGPSPELPGLRCDGQVPRVWTSWACALPQTRATAWGCPRRGAGGQGGVLGAPGPGGQESLGAACPRHPCHTFWKLLYPNSWHPSMPQGGCCGPPGPPSSPAAEFWFILSPFPLSFSSQCPHSAPAISVLWLLRLRAAASRLGGHAGTFLPTWLRALSWKWE